MTVASNVDEESLKAEFKKSGGGSAENLSLRLAEEKARVVSQLYPYSFVLGADQVLECEGRLFDKPASLSEARSHLIALRGRQHRLVNGLVVCKGADVLWSHTAIATLTFRDFSDDFLDRYLQISGESLLSSVGGYRLEDQGSQLFDSIEGDYFTILGLPMLPLLAYLRQIHILET